MNTNPRIGYAFLWLSLLLGVGAVGYLPALLPALAALGHLVTGSTTAYEMGKAIGTFVRVLAHFGIPYLLWVQGRDLLNQRLT
jgi:hypothetical protein